MFFKVLVLGYGVTGQSACRFLSTRGYSFDVWQSRWSSSHLTHINEYFPTANVYSGTHPATLSDYAQVVVSPGIAPHQSLVREIEDYGLPILGDVELFARHSTTPVIAVSGTNGKSSVVTMIGALLQQAGIKAIVCGNIGLGVLDVIDEPAEVLVMELSSYQLHYQSSLAPVVACLLNLTPDHLDWHGSFEAYVAAKQRIFARASCAVYYFDQCQCHPVADVQKTLSFSDISDKADYSTQSGAVMRKGETYLRLDALPLDRMLSVNNLLAALAVVDGYGVNSDACAALKDYAGLPHRQQWVAEHNGVQWYNDSKATNVNATRAAIVSVGARCHGKLIWIAGGRGKGETLAPLLPAVVKHVSAGVFLGELKSTLSASFVDHIEVCESNSMAEAVAMAAELAKPGDTVLLSPAAASFDMFDNYEARGQSFVEQVNLVTHVS